MKFPVKIFIYEKAKKKQKNHPQTLSGIENKKDTTMLRGLSTAEKRDVAFSTWLFVATKQKIPRGVVDFVGEES